MVAPYKQMDRETVELIVRLAYYQILNGGVTVPEIVDSCLNSIHKPATPTHSQAMENARNSLVELLDAENESSESVLKLETVEAIINTLSLLYLERNEAPGNE